MWVSTLLLLDVCFGFLLLKHFCLLSTPLALWMSGEVDPQEFCLADRNLPAISQSNGVVFSRLGVLPGLS